VGLLIFVCLLTGPHARWVKRFLPNTANRVVFVLIVTGMIVAWVVQGIELMKHGERGQEYFPFAFALLCGGALYRFVHVWWVRTEKSG
jgi:hypothetical protein